LNLNLAGCLLGLHIDSEDAGSSSSEMSFGFHHITHYIPVRTFCIQEESTHKTYLVLPAGKYRVPLSAPAYGLPGRGKKKV
jgi:methyl coenzyme M reductase subunit C